MASLLTYCTYKINCLFNAITGIYNFYLKPNISETKLLILYATKKKVSCPFFPVPINNTVITIDARKNRGTDRQMNERKEGRKKGRKEEG